MQSTQPNKYLEKIAELKSHEKVAFNISSMMPAKPKVTIGLSATMSRAGALKAAIDHIPTQHFGPKAMAKLAANVNGRVLPNGVHEFVDGAIDRAKGVGKIVGEGAGSFVGHVNGRTLSDHVANVKGITDPHGLNALGNMSDAQLRMRVRRDPAALKKFDSLLQKKRGARTLAIGGALYGLHRIMNSDKQQQDYGTYQNYYQ